VDERRKYARAPVSIPVAVVFPDDTRLDTSSRDLSLGGAFLFSKRTLPFNSRVTVSFRLPGLDADTVVACTVRWSTPDGIGIQFDPMGARETAAILGLMKK
jgi:type IV pilus assembly protein PilZ